MILFITDDFKTQSIDLHLNSRKLLWSQNACLTWTSSSEAPQDSVQSLIKISPLNIYNYKPYSLQHLRESVRSDGQVLCKLSFFVCLGGGGWFWSKNKCSLISAEIVKLLPFGMFKQKNESKLSNFKFVVKNSCKTFFGVFFSAKNLKSIICTALFISTWYYSCLKSW